MNEENQVYFVDSDQLPPAALERKHRLEQDPSFRTNHMEYNGQRGSSFFMQGYAALCDKSAADRYLFFFGGG